MWFYSYPMYNCSALQWEVRVHGSWWSPRVSPASAINVKPVACQLSCGDGRPHRRDHLQCTLCLYPSPVALLTAEYAAVTSAYCWVSSSSLFFVVVCGCGRCCHYRRCCCFRFCSTHRTCVFCASYLYDTPYGRGQHYWCHPRAGRDGRRRGRQRGSAAEGADKGTWVRTAFYSLLRESLNTSPTVSTPY